VIAALFVSPTGPYFGRPDIDAWDESRDARTYDGQYPVVCHPPCQLWVNLAAVNWKRYGRQKPAWYPGGSDGGGFASALRSVLGCGGVLEHPASSHAWEYYRLPKPSGLGWTRHLSDIPSYDEVWVCEVWQSAYGHRAHKRTWLLYSGNQPPAELNWSRKPGTHQVGWFDREKPTVGKREAFETPAAFAEALIALALNSRKAVAA
jgi:hypothetical protein